MKTKKHKTIIPAYSLDQFRQVHRLEEDASSFGYNHIDPARKVAGFELYSSEGLMGSVGPLKSMFYRMSITISGTLDMQIGLEHYQHQPRTLSFTYPNQVFSKSNISADAFGYYILFDAAFLSDLIPAAQFSTEFPFFSLHGNPVFVVAEEELNNIIALLIKMNNELQQEQAGRMKAIQLYLYLALLEAKRSYERQQLDSGTPLPDNHTLVSRFHKLVSTHFLTKRQVADYAQLLAVTPNHLNRVVKEVTAQTASDSIREMLLQEAKSQLKYTDLSIAEIAYQLDFSDPASFNRFFKKAAGETPLTYRNTCWAKAH